MSTIQSGKPKLKKSWRGGVSTATCQRILFDAINNDNLNRLSFPIEVCTIFMVGLRQLT